MTDQTPTLRTRALDSLATHQAEQARREAEKINLERKDRRISLLGALERVLGIQNGDPAAETDPEGRWAIVDGIYFEDATPPKGSYAEFKTALRVFLDLQDGDGAIPHSITSLVDLGTLFEEYGDGNLVDAREYVGLWRGRGEENDAQMRLMPSADAERLLASGEGWSLVE